MLQPGSVPEGRSGDVRRREQNPLGSTATSMSPTGTSALASFLAEA